MRVIGVVDLLDGRAVHARAGDRAHYAPVSALANRPIDGNALALARAYVDDLGLAEIYVADLDAIVRRTPQWAMVSSLAALGVPLWLDAGVADAEDLRKALDGGATHAVVGLETLASFDELREMCAAVAPARIAFSLDLRNGGPMARHDEVRDLDVRSIAARAVDAGVVNLIVLDVSRVGVAAGLDLELMAAVRGTAPATSLIAGGGVRDADDVRRLADVGCDGVLIATALQNGRIAADEVAALRRLRRHGSGRR
jgi:phosphoribosylformimino-5-aminoimidazole carboxamide ribotide isomerase